MGSNGFSVRLGILLFFGAVAAQSGCGSDGTVERLLNVFVIRVPGVTISGERPAVPDEATSMRVTITGDNDPWGKSVEVPLEAGHADIPPFSYGSGRQVTVEVLADGTVVSRGRTVKRKVLAGDSTLALNVFVSPVNSFSRPYMPAESGSGELQPTQVAVFERFGASATLLKDGRVLIAGGASPSVAAGGFNGPTDITGLKGAAEVFDPETGTFSPVGDLNTPRAFHQAVLLDSGKVVIMGGYEAGADGKLSPSPKVEVFDPGSGTFTPSSNLPGNAGRALFTAAVADSRSDMIFITGGRTEPPQASGFWDLYIPGVGAVGHGELRGQGHRWNHTMTYLRGFRSSAGNPGNPAFVLIGGENESGVVDSVEAYVGPVTDDSGHPVMNLDTGSVAQIPGGGRTLHSAVFVPDQRIVYVIGGFLDMGLKRPTDRIDIFWEEKGMFDASLSLVVCPEGGTCSGQARGAATAVLMDGNAILIAGGIGESGQALASTEIVMETVQQGPDGPYYTPVVVTDRTPSLPVPRFGHVALFDATRRVFMLGGLRDSSSPVPQPDSVVFYNPE